MIFRLTFLQMHRLLSSDESNRSRERTTPSRYLSGLDGTLQSREIFQMYIHPHIDGKQIRYIGTVDDSEKNEMLGKSAALLMPIDIEEAFGLVMAEAMACGTPVVGFRRGAVPEVVSHGITGFVCDSVDGMVESVQNIEEIDRTACRSRCEEMFSQNAMVNAYERVYRARISDLKSS
jgi:glycosyltransferase involved in cell wall biosynthesis